MSHVPRVITGDPRELVRGGRKEKGVRSNAIEVHNVNNVNKIK